MNKQVRVNILSNATSKPRKERRNGREVMVVSSATLPDGVIMNDIMYPAEEIEASYKTLNRTPAPLGHPTLNGGFVSASDPEGINIGWVGAWNENARRENGRVFIDKVIDIEVANRTDAGKELLEAINKGEPIHTSTALLCSLEEAPDDVAYKSIARNMHFDHDAILLNEAGAATPEQGVGLMVNSEGQEIEVVNSVLADEAMRDLEWAADWAVRAAERMERASIVDRIKTAILEAIKLGSDGETTSTNGDQEMSGDTEKKLNELSNTVEGLEKTVGQIGETISNAIGEALKPLTDNLAEMKANQEAKDEQEKTELVNKIVEANLMSESAAKELTLNSARELAEKAVPGKAAALNGAGPGNENPLAYDMNAVQGLTEGDK